MDKQQICELAKENWWRPDLVADAFLDNSHLKYQKRNKVFRNIAIYYRNIVNGGAQKVVVQLANMWADETDAEGNLIYDVVLITEETKENEYELNPKVKRAYLPDRNETQMQDYGKRYDAWIDILEKYEIDVVVSGMWLDATLFWDVLTIKSFYSHPAFILHNHSYFATPYKLHGSMALTHMKLYSIIDGVVTLSEYDKKYVELFSNHVKCILNPITFYSTDNNVNKTEKPIIMWCARISKEKAPLDALIMMREVVRHVPEAQLYLVGGGDAELEERVRIFIQENHLGKNVVLTGYSEDVEQYYKKASVFILTSEYEGFCLSIAEALSCGVPVISYDMPWLTLLQDERGTITVPHGRTDLLSEHVIEVLKDTDNYQQLSRGAIEKIEDLKKIDIASEWNSFFDELDKKDSVKTSQDKQWKIIFQKVAEFQQLAKDEIRTANAEQNAKLQKVYAEKSELNAKLQRTYEEKSELNATLQRTYEEKSELNATLQRTYEEKSELNATLQRTYEEKSELNATLQKTYEEKSELNAKLQKTYAEKSERGNQIKQLQAKNKELNMDLKDLKEKYKTKISGLKEKQENTQSKLERTQAELNAYKETYFYKIYRKLQNMKYSKDNK